MKEKFKEFAISSWAIDNRITIFMLTLVIIVAGMVSFQVLPKENFPEIQIPIMFVSTPYPGTSAEDIENLVSRKIEKQIKGLEGIKEINSTSIQDFSSVFVEFETDVDLDEAKREVQEAVDRAKADLPNDLPADPQVADINISELPIMFMNVSGPYDNVTLKTYSEDLQEEIEKLKEILRVDIVGAPEREIQINVDLYKAENASITMGDIEKTVSGENVIISGGEIETGNHKIAVRLNGEFQSIDDVRNLLIRGGKGNALYLKDIATVVDGFKEKDSYARLNGQPVMTLNVIKKGGENLVDAADKIKVITEELKEKKFPEDLTVSFSADQSVLTRNTLSELTNTIIIGFILVTIVLMFFMGIRDALFVGLAVPLSSFIAFSVLPILGFTMNLIVLFSFILAMGIVVDNAIVVIENTYRLFTEQKLPIVTAAKKAAGEVIGPVFAGTLTTICPFLPLLFWDGTVGEFMGFMPVVMIITLFASLFVAYVINPVFAAAFMKRKKEGEGNNHKQIWIYTGIALVLGLLFHIGGSPSFGNFMIFMGIFVVFYNYALKYAIHWFQDKAIVTVKNAYKNTLEWSLDHPWTVMIASVGFIFLTIAFISISNLKTIQFPRTDPNFVYVFNELPNGTNIEETDSVTRILEKKVYEVIGQDNPIVKAVITNVAIGAGDPNSFDQNTSNPHKSKIAVEFVGVKERNGKSTTEVLEAIRENVKGIAGTKISVEQDKNEPPGSAPIEIQITSEEFGNMMNVSEDLFAYLDSLSSKGEMKGFEEMKWDVDEKRPEMMIMIDREKANALGLSSGQIGMEMRTALFGKEISKLRTNEDEYNIVLRLDEGYREEISSLLNMRVTFMDMATGRFKSVPISSVADFEYSASYGGINRSDLEKSVRITGNVPTEYNINDVFAEVEYWVNDFVKQGRKDKLVSIEVGGQSKDQEEQMVFLGGAFIASIILIFMILVTQFNSFSNVIIILSQVLLSVVGVFLAHAVLGMEFSVVLSGVGIVTLAGIVVNNGIILLDFFQILQKRGYGLRDSIIEGGAVRFTPVILTASSTILGLVPLAFSLNINFSTLLSDLDPQIFFGGDSAAFWQPFAWSIIFGLGFATIITLVIVPVIYYQVKRFEAWLWELLGSNDEGIDDEIIEDDHYHNGVNGSSNGNGAEHVNEDTKESEDPSEIGV